MKARIALVRSLQDLSDIVIVMLMGLTTSDYLECPAELLFLLDMQEASSS